MCMGSDRTDENVLLFYWRQTDFGHSNFCENGFAVYLFQILLSHYSMMGIMSIHSINMTLTSCIELAFLVFCWREARKGWPHEIYVTFFNTRLERSSFQGVEDST